MCVTFTEADIDLKTNDGRTAVQWAIDHNQYDILELFQKFEYEKSKGETLKTSGSEHLLAMYDKSVSGESIDFDLILAVIKYIRDHLDDTNGILVFLPGYDDIISCQEKLLASSTYDKSKINLVILHGSMDISTQDTVFRKVPGMQKIILATNVAETSVTIDDVVYVIDSGKAKQITYDSVCICKFYLHFCTIYST